MKPTTVVPAAAADSTASRGTADVANPVVTGRNPKKSQAKKTKRGKNEEFSLIKQEMWLKGVSKATVGVSEGTAF